MENQYIESIDVIRIMEEIKKEIKEKGYMDDLPEFSDIFYTMPPSRKGIFDIEEFEAEVQYLNEHWNISAYRQLPKWGRAGEIKVFIKKVIRKCVAFYIEPIVKDQDYFNEKITSSFNILNLYIAQMRAENEELKKRITQLESGSK